MSAHLTTCKDCEAAMQALESEADALVVGLGNPETENPFVGEPEYCRAVAALRLLRPVSAGPEIHGPGTTATQPLPPKQLGEYELLGCLGKGGMGAVYKARHRKLKRIVALKVLPAHQRDDEQAIARFEREMEVIGQLSHPHVVQAHDAGEIGGMRFLVMECVDGLNLSELVARLGPLPIPDACELARQAALGLQYAHEHGLVHRDIKPSNLMLASAGQLKILDLGLALFKVMPSCRDEMTGTGQALGTVDYIAPEQASDSHHVDIRADIYSLGCTLYNLLSGHAPYHGPKYHSPIQKLLGHGHDPVPPIQRLRAEVPGDLVAVIERMLAKDPAQRFLTPADVAESIAPFTKGCDLSGLAKAAEKKFIATSGQKSAGGNTAPLLSSALTGTEPNDAKDVSPILKRKRPSESLPVDPRRRPFASLLPPFIRRVVRRDVTIGLISFGIGLAIVLGIIITVKKDGSETVIKVPEGSEVRVTQNAHAPVSSPTANDVRRGEGGMQKPEVMRNEPRQLPVPSATVGPAASPKQPDSRREQHGRLPVAAVAPFNAARAREYQEQWAKYLGLPMEISNSIGMKLVLIPPGEFDMGSTQEEVDRLLREAAERDLHPGYVMRIPRETPRHHVTISKPFYFGTFAVTQKEYQEVMGDSPSAFSSTGKHQERVSGQDTSRFPAESLSWSDAKRFCDMLSSRAQEKAAQRLYRLPTEAQWEYACRAGTATRFSFGDEETDLGDYGWCKFGSNRVTHAVGEKKPGLSSQL
jgi:serine/threonine protein kinase/formylglycine-generating enzyme required for sulfatase activity